MPKKVAAVVTEYRKWSHADVILRNLLDGYPDGKQARARTRRRCTPIRCPKKDMSRDLAKKHGFKIYETIADCLTLGGKSLAVDGVLSIGEHGKYPDQREGPDSLPAAALLRGDLQGLREVRKVGAGLQRQAPRRHLGRREVDVRPRAEAHVSAPRGLVDAGDVAQARSRCCRRGANSAAPCRSATATRRPTASTRSKACSA